MPKVLCFIVLVFMTIPCIAQESSADGFWSGKVALPEDRRATVYLEISAVDSKEQAGIQIKVTSPEIELRQSQPIADSLHVTGETVSFLIQHDEKTISVNLLKSGPNEMQVEWAFQPATKEEANSTPAISKSVFTKWPAFSEADSWSKFSGVIRNRLGDLQCTLQLMQLNENWVGVASLDPPGIKHFPLSDLSVSGNAISFTLKHKRSLDFEGTFDNDRVQITGEFSQQGITLPCTLSQSRKGDSASSEVIADEFPDWANRSWMVRRHAKPQWAITNVSVVDVVSGDVRSGQNILIEGDLIVSISGKPVSQKTKCVDGSGKFVIPGLIDMHAHIQPMDIASLPGSEMANLVLKGLLDHGVTTVRGLPLYSEFASATAGRTNLNPSLGPTVIPGSGVFEREPQRSSWGFRDPETARRWVQREAMLGTRWIKVYNKMDVRSLTQIVESAEEYGMFVCGHAQDVPPHVASEIGMHTIEHATGIPLSCLPRGVEPPDVQDLARRTAWLWENVDESRLDKLTELFSKNKTGWVPTLVVMEAIAVNGGRLGGTPLDDSTKKSLGLAVEKAAALAVKMHRSDVLVGLGTDFPVEGILPGISAHRELEILVEAGATPLEALQIATVNSAMLLRVEDVTGTVAEEKLADLIVLDANPLEDITNIAKIAFVVHAGLYHQPSAASGKGD